MTNAIVKCQWGWLILSISGEWDSGAGSDCSEGVSEIEGEEKEEEGRRKSSTGGEEGRQSRGEDEENDRRVIQPDICAISQLLNFDEVRWCCICAQPFR